MRIRTNLELIAASRPPGARFLRGVMVAPCGVGPRDGTICGKTVLLESFERTFSFESLMGFPGEDD